MDQPLSFLDSLVIDPSDAKLAGFEGLSTYQDLKLSTLDAPTLFAFVKETHQALQTLIPWNPKNNTLVLRICEKLIEDRNKRLHPLSHLTLHHAFHWDNNIPLDDFHPLSLVGRTLFIHDRIVSMMGGLEDDALTEDEAMMEPLQPQLGLFFRQANQKLIRVCQRAIADESILKALIKQNEKTGYLSAESLCTILMKQGLAQRDFLKWSDIKVRRQMLLAAIEV
jgi:hypothetical protein